MIYVGTSGWQYKDWRGRFYPRDMQQREWLAYFSARFPTVEVNNSFYRLPERATFERWGRESAPGFVVTVKASRFITHVKRMKEPVEPLKLLWERARGLGPKLGPVLFQFPPKFRVDPPRLEEFLGALPQGMRAAFEFRDASWHADATYELLDRAGAALVMADSPGARVPGAITGGWAYVRFHKGTAVSPGYTRRKLRAWAERIAEMRARDVWVYFNNDTGGAAIRDAIAMTDMLGALGAPVVRARGAARLAG
jgi:uncharacterized protein YecE (DUF72 family)